MSDTNTVVLVGRLTRDPEIKGNGEKEFLTLSLAVNGWKDDDVSFFDISVFGKQVPSVAQYTHKGSRVAVTGQLRQRRWEKDGQKRSAVSIAANSVQFLEAKQQPAAEEDSVPF